MPSLVDLRATARDRIWLVASVAMSAAVILTDRMVFPL